MTGTRRRGPRRTGTHSDIAMNPFQPHQVDLGNDTERLLQTFDSGVEALTTATSNDVLAQVRARKKLATRLGLGQRLLRIYDEVKFVPEIDLVRLERVHGDVRAGACSPRPRTLQRIDGLGVPLSLLHG